MSPRAGRGLPNTTFDRRKLTDEPAPTRGRRAADRMNSDVARESAAPDPKLSRKRRATRDGREPLVVYMPPESIKALKFAALEYDTTASAIVQDAVTRWLESTRVRRTK